MTTIINDVDNVDNLLLLNTENGLSKKNFFAQKTNAPRPFAQRTKTARDPTPSSSRNVPTRRRFFNNNSNNSNINNNNNNESIETEREEIVVSSKSTRRPRPTISRTSTTEAEVDEEEEYKPRPTYSYRPGYRGTARFRHSTTRSGEYKHDEAAGSFIDDNRLRSLNLDRSNKRPLATSTTTQATTEEERQTKTRPSTVRSRPTLFSKKSASTTEEPVIENESTVRSRPNFFKKSASTTEEPIIENESTVRSRPNFFKKSTTTTEEPEIEDETTTENRIIENKNRFNLNADERPERLRFELTAGGKINFGFASVKSRENENVTLPTKGPDSKIRVITGPLEKSPLIESGRNYKKGHVEEIPISKPETVTIQNFSDKLELSEIPLNKSDIESFVSSDDLRTDAPDADETTEFVKKSRLRPSKIGFKKRPVEESNENEITTVETVIEAEIDTTTTTARPKLRPFATRERLSRPQVKASVKNELSDEISSGKILTRNRISQRGRVRGQNNEEESSQSEESFVKKSQLRPEQNVDLESSSPRGFQNRFTGRTRAKAIKKVEEIKTSDESTTRSYLTKVKASDFFKNRRVNAVQAEDNENSETQDILEESTLRTRFRFGSADPEVLDLITEKPDEENEIDFSTIKNDDDDETTLGPYLEASSILPTRRLTIRKRPAKKIDFQATRQTITVSDEKSNDLEIENTSSFSSTTDDSSDDNEIYETEIETATDGQKETTASTTTLGTKPTRRVLVTRKRVIAEKVSEEPEQSEEREALPPRTTTKKRILTIRTRTGVIYSPVEVGNFETTESSTEPSIDEGPAKTQDTDLVRKRIRVYQQRSTTEKAIEESSTQKQYRTRTRILKRPLPSQNEIEEASVSTFEETSTFAAARASYSPRRRIVKVTRRPVAISSVAPAEDIEEEEEERHEEVEQEEGRDEEREAVIDSSSSSVAPAPKRKTFRILRTKTPRVIVDRPLVEDTLVIKNDDENQQIDENIEENVEERENIEEENVEVSSEEPSLRPLLKYPTRAGSRVTVVKKRPAFTQGSRSTTIHPASTRFAVGNNAAGPTRFRQITKTRSRIITSTEGVPEEIDEDQRIKLDARRKKIFTKGYRKTTATTTTSAPNITPRTIDTNESETNEYDTTDDTTDIPQINNNDDILQTKPRFSLSRFTTSTSPKPTTLHHVFAIDINEDDVNRLTNLTRYPEDQADEVIKKLQKLIEINRIVEVYSKEEKLKLLKNKKFKSIKAGELTVERPPALESFGEVSRHVIIKLVKPNNGSVNASTERSPKSIMFAETIFGKLETSTISLEGLFEREKKELKLKKEGASEALKVLTPLLRPESNETIPLVISIANLDQVILSKVQRKLGEASEETTTESSVDDTTTFVNDDD